jgi:desulfoferrodoxin (superoxide reductase-like protein)
MGGHVTVLFVGKMAVHREQTTFEWCPTTETTVSNFEAYSAYFRHICNLYEIWKYVTK